MQRAQKMDDADFGNKKEDFLLNKTINMHRRKMQPICQSAFFCAICGAKIPEQRRRALPGIQICVTCKRLSERTGYGID